MQRIEGCFWPNYQFEIKSLGLVYNDTPRDDGSVMSYWRDGAYYRFEKSELDTMDVAARMLYQMFIEAGDYLIKNRMLGKLAIPEWAWDAVEESWNRHDGHGDPTVYGRFDLRFGGDSDATAGDPSLAVPKLLEFNADTPTSIVESSVVQWQWFLMNFDPNEKVNQWNELDEKLVPAWKRQLDQAFITVQRYMQDHPFDHVVHFAFTSDESSGEDLANTRLMQQYAEAAGFKTKIMHIENVQYRVEDDALLDEDGDPIYVMFKLYPWEWIVTEHYEDQIEETMCKAVFRDVQRQSAVWIEPLWKMLWSNKGILPALWTVFRDDPKKSQFLLPAYFEGEEPRDIGAHVRKPLLAREGADIEIIGADGMCIDSGIRQYYGREGFIVQEFAPLPNFHSELDGDHRPVMGVWMVEDEPAGLGIRECSGLITDNISNFVPHVF